MMINFFLYISDNFLNMMYFNILLFLLSWLGMAFADNFMEAFFFLEMVYLSLIIFCTLFSVLTNYFLFDLLIIFMLFFSICDSMLGLMLTLITFNTNKNMFMKTYHYAF